MKLLIITPEQRELIDPYALEKFDKFMNDLKQQGHLEELTEADFNQYLSEEEIKACINLQASIVEWVRRCSQPEISIDTRYSTPYWDLMDMSKLVRKVYERKQAEQRLIAEQQRKQEAERIAQQEKEESERRAQQKRIKEESERRARQEVLEAKRRAEQEEEEQQRMERLAQVKAKLTHTEEEFKQKLSEDKLPITYPLEHYHPDLWFEFESPTDDEILAWLRPQAYAVIPEDLTGLVTWRWLSKPRIDIHAYYEKKGAPCIVFNFIIKTLAKVIFYFKTGSYNYHGFTVKLDEERLGEVIIQKQYEDVGEVSVPISLLSFLITDELEAKGIEVTSMHDGYMEYLVSGYKGEVTIHSDFRRFLRDICQENGLVRGLLAWGLIDNQIAEIVEAKMNEPGQLRSEQEMLQGKTRRRGSKKTRVFQLFSEGKRPRDVDVKRLGIKPKTVYRYYQEWKRL